MTREPNPPGGISDPQATLLRLIYGAQAAQVVYIAAKLGLADLLKDGPRTATDLAAYGFAAATLFLVALFVVQDVLLERLCGVRAGRDLGMALWVGSVALLFGAVVYRGRLHELATLLRQSRGLAVSIPGCRSPCWVTRPKSRETGRKKHASWPSCRRSRGQCSASASSRTRYFETRSSSTIYS